VRRRLVVITAAVVVLVLGGLAVAVAVLDARGKDKIADGVRVGTVDVGGLTEAEARAKVRRELLEPLDEPIVVTYDGRTWKLTAKDAHVRADVDGMVDEAMRRSQEGGVLERAWRQATGGKVNATIPAQVEYSRKAISRFVADIKKDVDVAPVDAEISFNSAEDLGATDGRPGVELKARRLKRRIEAAIANPDAKRTVRAKTRTVEPAVTRETLAENYPVVLTVDRNAFKLHLWKGLKLEKTYDVRVGQQGLETPAGLYHIQNKAIDPAWNVPYSDWTGDLAGKVIPGGVPENPLKSRWMGIYDGAGIHGIDPSQYHTIGTAASHGCVGMRIPDVEELYDEVPVGAPIYIE